jgi:hypothetical protein
MPAKGAAPENKALKQFNLTYEFITNFEFFICTQPVKESDPCRRIGTMSGNVFLSVVVSLTKMPMMEITGMCLIIIILKLYATSYIFLYITL